MRNNSLDLVKIPGIFFLTVIFCALYGFDALFGPGISINDQSLFKKNPYILLHNNQYTLKWRYANNAFYFQPQSKIIKGELIFSLQATTSSGNLTGRNGEIPITDSRKIKAQKKSGGVWLGPRNKKTKLEIRTLL